MSFGKFDQIILAEHKTWSLQSLLHKYRQIAREFVFEVGKLKSSYVKEVLIEAYGDDIGFYERSEKNERKFVYYTKGGGNYVKATLSKFLWHYRWTIDS